MLRLLPLLLLCLPAQAGDPGELAIYPGFSKAERARSVRVVTGAARRCATLADPPEEAPQTRPTSAPHLAVEVIDGDEVSLQQREIELQCGTEPVRKCAASFVWAEGSDQVGYASVQCFGSHEDPYASYLVTASVDLRKAKKADVRGTRKDKATILSSLTFQTDAFPGLHVTAFVEQRRRDGSTETPPQVVQFDDYAKEDAASGALTPDEVAELAGEVVRTACDLTGACTAEPAFSVAER